MIFEDTDETLGFYESYVVDAKCRELKRNGWVKAPAWLPVPHPGYDWKFPGMIYAYIKPKPKLRHILKYKIFSLRSK